MEKWCKDHTLIVITVDGGKPLVQQYDLNHFKIADVKAKYDKFEGVFSLFLLANPKDGRVWVLRSGESSCFRVKSEEENWHFIINGGVQITF